MESKEPRARGPVLPGLLVALLLVAFVVLRSPEAAADRFRRVLDQVRGGDETSYAFLAETAVGRPVGWDPCTPIEYAVNPAGAPDDWEEVVETAVDETGRSSGFSFAFAGTTTERDYTARTGSPLLVTWADPADDPELEGNVAGAARTISSTVNGRSRWVAASITLDAGEYGDMGDDEQRLILAHELGHVLGLDHVDDTDELMNPQYVGQDGFGDGDRAGLAVLRQNPCE